MYQPCLTPSPDVHTSDTLRRLAIDDAMVTRGFERKCNLAARILNVPVSLVTLIDGDRQVVRGCKGTESPFGLLLDVPIPDSFCRYIVQTRKPLIVGDAREHPLMRRDSTVHGDTAIAYLGMPLIVKEGEVLGSFCVLDTQPRVWTEDDIEIMRELSASVVTKIELRYQLLEHERITNELCARDHLFQELLRSFPNGSVNVFDLDMRYTFAAGMGLRQFNVAPESLPGKHLADLFPEAWLAEMMPYCRRARDGETVEFEAAYNGMSFIVNATPLRDTDGTITSILVVTHNITERKRIEQDLELARRLLLESREAERLRLARELHDGAVQQLLGISYQLFSAPQRVAVPGGSDVSQAMPQEARPEVIRKQILDVVSQLRGLMRELRPAGIEELGLCAALEGYIAQLHTEYDGTMPRIVTDFERDEPRLSTSVGVCLFRVAQEAIRNALNHADAQQITVGLRFGADEVELWVHDNGQGFAVPDRLSQLVHDNHFGFVGMSERVATVGGLLTVDSQLGCGTTVSVQVGLNGRVLTEV